MDSFLSMFPKNLFGCNTGNVETIEGESTAASSLMLVDENGRKRARGADSAASSSSSSSSSAQQQPGRSINSSSNNINGVETHSGSGSRTPTLLSTSPRASNSNNNGVSSSAASGRGGSQSEDSGDDDEDEDEEDIRPVKRFRGEKRVIPVKPNSSAAVRSAAEEDAKRKKAAAAAAAAAKKEEEEMKRSPLSKLPEDVLAHCLSFLGSASDRHALQCTSKTFRKISNEDGMLKHVQVGGDRSTGLHGIIQEQDTPETASKALQPYANAGNLEAIYMIGIIKSYCHQDVEGGISMLKHAASKGYVRASYALGLALRDSKPAEANRFMKEAADDGYIPALQELLPARTMKAKYGEPKADELRLHLDPLCLNRLLSRYYVQSAELRDLNTSHCWNPLCGRWAFKATINSSGGSNNNATAATTDHRGGNNNNHRRPLGFSFRNALNPSRNNHNNNNSDAAAAAAASSESSGDADANAASMSGNASDNPPLPALCRCSFRVSRMKMCSRCCRAKYCSKLCQVYDWRSGRHKMECQFL